MIVNRHRSNFSVGLWSLVFACAACAAPIGSSSPSQSGDDPLTQLCDASDRTSLAAIATALERADDDTADVTELSASLDQAKSNLAAISVDASVEPAVDEALAAIDDLQEVIEDPDSRAEARTQVALAFRGLQAVICP
jgi:hypothetical protein